MAGGRRPLARGAAGDGHPRARPACRPRRARGRRVREPVRHPVVTRHHPPSPNRHPPGTRASSSVASSPPSSSPSRCGAASRSSRNLAESVVLPGRRRAQCAWRWRRRLACRPIKERRRPCVLCRAARSSRGAGPRARGAVRRAAPHVAPSVTAGPSSFIRRRAPRGALSVDAPHVAPSVPAGSSSSSRRAS